MKNLYISLISKAVRPIRKHLQEVMKAQLWAGKKSRANLWKIQENLNYRRCEIQLIVFPEAILNQFDNVVSTGIPNRMDV